MVEVVLRSHVWLFTGVLQEIRREVTRKVLRGVKALKGCLLRQPAFGVAMASREASAARKG